MLDAVPSSTPERPIHAGDQARDIDPSSPSWVAGGGDRAAHGFVDTAIRRLEELIEEETAALRSRGRIDLKDFNNRKAHGLLELSRALRHYDGVAADEAIRLRLSGLRAKLETNRAVLKMHLDAAREISTIVTEAIQKADSDGTYSLSIRQKRP
jgi:hypothetical protein